MEGLYLYAKIFPRNIPKMINVSLVIFDIVIFITVLIVGTKVENYLVPKLPYNNKYDNCDKSFYPIVVAFSVILLLALWQSGNITFKLY